jgi:hypothetical protein
MRRRIVLVRGGKRGRLRQRASNYYGTAEFYLRDNPASAPEVAPPAAHRAVFDRLGVILATPRPDMA